MGDDLMISKYFDELVKALHSSTAVMTSVTEKLASLEKSNEALADEIDELNGSLKNGKLKEIVESITGLGLELKEHHNSCRQEISQSLTTLGTHVAPDRLKGVMVQAIKQELDPDVSKATTPVVVKQEQEIAAWKEWINGKVLVVAGAFVALFELGVKIYYKVF